MVKVFEVITYCSIVQRATQKTRFYESIIWPCKNKVVVLLPHVLISAVNCSTYVFAVFPVNLAFLTADSNLIITDLTSRSAK